MPILFAFNKTTNWEALDNAIRSFADMDGVREEDLLAALRAVEIWREQFTNLSTSNHGKQITWYRYELLIWSLGESFRSIMRRVRSLRRCERVFEAVRSLCFDRRFGKGRESFTMLLGQYGGPAQIPTLIKLLEDEDVSGHAVYALRLLGASEAANSVRPFLNSPKTWVRKEALKFFRQIEPV